MRCVSTRLIRWIAFLLRKLYCKDSLPETQWEKNRTQNDLSKIYLHKLIYIAKFTIYIIFIGLLLKIAIAIWHMQTKSYIKDKTNWNAKKIKKKKLLHCYKNNLALTYLVTSASSKINFPPRNNVYFKKRTPLLQHFISHCHENTWL